MAAELNLADSSDKNIKKLWDYWVTFKHERIYKPVAFDIDDPFFIKMVDREKIIDLLFENWSQR